MDDWDHAAVPALIIERAKFGSLADFLGRREQISDDEKLALCADVTAGLLALHRSEVIHGDVKADNVLVFEGSGPERQYCAKLADFGSVISIAPSKTGYGRYLGTKTTNAPEVEHQSSRFSLDAPGLIKCDVYSLGLLIVEMITQGLSPPLSSKNKNVLSDALHKIAEVEASGNLKSAASLAIKQLLPWDPRERCTDLSFVLDVLRYCTIMTSGSFFGGDFNES